MLKFAEGKYIYNRVKYGIIYDVGFYLV